MDAEWKPGGDEVKTVLEAHGLIPEGPLLGEALGLGALYADLIRQRLGEVPASDDRKKALLAIIEEGLMQEGLIPNNHARRFLMPSK